MRYYKNFDIGKQKIKIEKQKIMREKQKIMREKQKSNLENLFFWMKLILIYQMNDSKICQKLF